jgi:hypothetical protein
MPFCPGSVSSRSGHCPVPPRQGAGGGRVSRASRQRAMVRVGLYRGHAAGRAHDCAVAALASRTASRCVPDRSNHIPVDDRGVDVVSLPKTSSRVTGQSECDTRTPDGRVSDQAAARRALQAEITRETRGRKHGPASAGDRTEPQGSVSGAAPEHRSADLRLAEPNVSLDFECDHSDQARDRDPVASTRLFGPIGAGSPASVVAARRSIVRSVSSSDG